jgi:pre-mRNA-splicing factor CWC26
MSGLQTYLASKYMSGTKADAILNRSAPKKKKRKHNDDPHPVRESLVVDEDGGWGDASNKDDVEEVEDVIVASDRSFKKRDEARASGGDTGWITVKEPTPPPTEDEKPLVVGMEDETPFKGGLVTASQLKKRASKAPPKKISEPAEEEQETVYRDASGRRIDTKAERAEAARKKREREELEAKKMEWGKGIVQRDEEERKRAELAAESMKDLARQVQCIHRCHTLTIYQVC